MNKIAVYTSIFGEIDLLLDPLNFKRTTNINYYCFTDRNSHFSDIYNIHIRESKFKDPSLNSRYYKILGDALLSDYDYVIWHDGNIQIDHSKIDELLTFSSNSFMTTFRHPHRACFYEEACVCVKRNKDSHLKILKQVLSYYYLGLPLSSGLFETGILVRNNFYKPTDFSYKWWIHILSYSRRDQLSLGYLVWREKIRMGILPGSGTKNIFSVYHPHVQKGPIRNKYIKFLVVKLILMIKPKPR